MKNLFFVLILSAISITAFGQEYYGKKISPTGSISSTELVKKMGDKKEFTGKVRGEIVSVCQMKGCWMTLDLGNGETMRVRFEDYAFFVPKDAEGEVVIEGTAKQVVTSVAELKHYAEDAGQSPEEIAKITEPKREITFEASGVIIFN